MKSNADPLEHIPEPEAVERLLADAVRRSALLRGLLRLARRKAAYPHPLPASTPAARRSPPDPKGVVHG